MRPGKTPEVAVVLDKPAEVLSLWNGLKLMGDSDEAKALGARMHTEAFDHNYRMLPSIKSQLRFRIMVEEVDLVTSALGKVSEQPIHLHAWREGVKTIRQKRVAKKVLSSLPVHDQAA